VRALAGALGQFHRLDPPIVHRDLKPQNNLMAGDAPRIADFGLGGAALRLEPDATGALSAIAVQVPTMLRAAGTARYASPEQMLGHPPHPRDDVYALGVIAYQLAVGDQTRTVGPDAGDVLRALGAPDEFVRLVAASIATDADRRPADASEWESALSGPVPEPPNVGRGAAVGHRGQVRAPPRRHVGGCVPWRGGQQATVLLRHDDRQYPREHSVQRLVQYGYRGLPNEQRTRPRATSTGGLLRW
jgi:serine/threonine protein kinase